MLDLSIIIVNWNTRQITADCLRSIQETVGPLQYEVILVDNASSDGSQAMIREQFGWVKLIENTTNAGFARANNQGIAAAQGRYVLLLNSDTIVPPLALSKLIAFAETMPAAGVVAPKLLNRDGSLQESWASFPSFLSEALGRNFRTRQPVPNQPSVYQVDWVGGACMLIPSRVLEQIGGLDEGIFMYTEETDLCYRIRQAGWDVIYLDNVEITHLGGGSARRSDLMQLVRLYESKIYFFRKHHGPVSGFVLRLVFIANNSVGLMKDAARWLLRRIRGETSNQRVQVRGKLILHLATRQNLRTTR